MIKNPDGTIVGRSLLRLLWDETEQKAVLFQARIYPDDTQESLKEVLVAMAKHRAEILGVPLVGSNEEDSTLGNYPNDLNIGC